MKRLLYSLAGVLVLAGAGFFFYKALAGSLVYFILPSEYAAAPQKYTGKIRLGGLVEAKGLKYNDKDLQLNFNITDSVKSYPVRYSGTPPEMFKADTGVVVVGKFEGDTFVSNEVLIKHSEEYKPEEGKKISLDELKNALE